MSFLPSRPDGPALGETLADLECGGFSETARSGPGHREARRDRRSRPAPAVRGRRLVDDLVERSAERAEAGETDLHADVGHAPVGPAEEEHRALDATALQVA